MAISYQGNSLPEEILSLICLELGKEGDFGSLYRCALSSRSFADPALRTMYMMHQNSPVFEQRDDLEFRRQAVDFATKAAEQAEFYRKWTLLWRSMTVSSLADDATYKPYCRYIRTLDFRNLSAMLEDLKFSGAVRRAFFANNLKSFHFPRKENNRQVIDIIATVNAIGEAITAKTTLLEEIDGHIGADLLPKWIARSPRLGSMVLWKGDTLANGAGAAVAQHCENFRSLTLHEWLSPDADENFASFLNDLRPDSLEYFEMISLNNLGKLSFEALGQQKSLKELNLGNLNQEAVENLNALKACTELHTLKLDDNFGTTHLEMRHNDVFLEVVQWLSSCHKLRDLSLKKFLDGPAILAQVLYSPNVKLTRLSLEGYTIRNTSAQLFHSALAEQKSLESVWLKGNGEDTTDDDLQIMVDGLSCLANLRELILKDVSDDFLEEHISSLALNLPSLEDFWTSGQEVSSSILDVFSNMSNLKNLTLYALTQFDADAIINFITNLDPEMQKGFTLSLMAADPTSGNLTEMEQEMIREFIQVQLGGRFEFVLWREADTSESDDD